MAQPSKENHILFLLIVGLLGWLVPGAGHFVLKHKKHAIIIFITIVLTFCTGLYIGSIGVLDYVEAKSWYLAQIMNSPMVHVLGYLAQEEDYSVYGRPNEIGQIYTGIAGVLNLLCIINAVYLAHQLRTKTTGD